MSGARSGVQKANADYTGVQESWCVSSFLQPTQRSISAALATSIWRMKCVNNCAVLSPSRC